MAHADAAISALRERLGLEVSKDIVFPTRYNVAPTQIMPVIKGGKEMMLALLHWGHLIQFKSKKKPTLLINGRSEEASHKRTFKQALQKQRCIVPADGFFEWLRSHGGKVRVPHYFRMKDNKTFWIAGLYWTGTESVPSNYILLTTAPNELMAPIHDRMPVILNDDAAKEWLADTSFSTERMREICVSYSASEMIANKVSPIVNNARNDDPRCIAPESSTSFEEEFFLQ